MNEKNSGEPSLESIEDYNGNESKSKKNTVRLVIVFILIVGGILAYLKNSSYENSKNEYVGTQEKPGITTIQKK